MWNSGRLVMSTSSAVSSIQAGKPSPAQAYARWVCITSLDRPVVPEVGMRTATSSGVAVSGRSGTVSGAPASQSPASPATSTVPSSAVAPSRDVASSTVAARSVSETSSRGRAWVSNPASSAAVARGLVGTAMAPSTVVASRVSRYGGVLCAVSTTRSPRRTPASCSPAATNATRAAAPANDSVPSSVRSQVPYGSRAAAARSSPVTVSPESVGSVTPASAVGPRQIGSRIGLAGGVVDVLDDRVHQLGLDGVVEGAVLAQLANRGHRIGVREEAVVGVVDRPGRGVKAPPRRLERDAVGVAEVDRPQEPVVDD